VSGQNTPPGRYHGVTVARWGKILAVQAVIALLLLEALLRIHNPLPFRLRGDEIVLPAGLRYQYAIANPGAKLEPVARGHYNRLGFRGPDPPADFGARLSIVAVGGSTTAGTLLSDGKTWPDEMARVLAASHPDIWVNNAGFEGHSTYGHLVLLRSVLTKLRPSMILVLAGINDVGMEPAGPGDEFELWNAGSWLWPRLARHSEVVNAALNLRRARAAARLQLSFDQPVDFAAPGHFTMTEEEIASALAQFDRFLEGYGTRLTTLALEARAAGIDPVFVTQPMLVGDAIDPATGVDLATFPSSRDRNGRADWRLMERFNDVMRRTAAGHGVVLVDLARLLPKDSRHYYDTIHFSLDGARRVGEIVAAELAPHLLR